MEKFAVVPFGILFALLAIAFWEAVVWPVLEFLTYEAWRALKCCGRALRLWFQAKMRAAVERLP